jgi:cytochrome P450
MPAKKEAPTRAAWASDRPDHPAPPEIEAPYFDDILNAWIFSQYKDVLAAMQSPDLYPAGSSEQSTVEPTNQSDMAKMRATTSAALTPAQLRAWQERISPVSQDLIHKLPVSQPVDLVEDYAQPASLALAAIVTGIDPEDAPRLYEMAFPLSKSAAEPYDASLKVQAKEADTELKKHFHTGPEALRDSGFVGLAHTLPCLLANAWLALLQHPHQWAELHQNPNLTEPAVEELLRHGGVPRILHRRATADVNINGCPIRHHDRVILRITAANHDPRQFSCPHELQVERRERGHLALGAGAHSCVGGSLIRMAVATITRPLVERFAHASLTEPVKWKGGSGFLSPVTLYVHLNDSR